MTTAFSSSILAVLVAGAVAAGARSCRALRRKLISDRVLAVYRKVMPPMSQTEREALEAGTVWWDGELFSGRPDWAALLASPQPTLTAEEQRFLDEERDDAVRDGDRLGSDARLPRPAAAGVAVHQGQGLPRHDHPEGVRRPRLLRVRALAGHHQAVDALAAPSAVTVMVPNSLGPGELLLHYGTDEQKQYYLPRLAKGLEIPCFALTNPYAGSDAAAIPDFGVVLLGRARRQARARPVASRGTSATSRSAPVATLLGLAFRVYDPEQAPGRQGRPRHHAAR